MIINSSFQDQWDSASKFQLFFKTIGTVHQNFKHFKTIGIVILDFNYSMTIGTVHQNFKYFKTIGTGILDFNVGTVILDFNVGTVILDFNETVHLKCNYCKTIGTLYTNQPFQDHDGRSQ